MVIRMKKQTSVTFGLLMVLALAGCEGRYPYVKGPNTLIAIDRDTGVDAFALPNGAGAIAYDPDGCQVWIVDDGFEGYSTRRFDPRTGLPICDGRYPPGTVLGNFETPKAGIRDFVPARAKTTE